MIGANKRRYLQKVTILDYLWFIINFKICTNSLTLCIDCGWRVGKYVNNGEETVRAEKGQM